MALRCGWIRIVLGFCVVLLLVVQTGCGTRKDLAGVATAGEGVLRRSHSRFSEETGERAYTYEVQPVDDKLELCIRIVLQSGGQHWQLTDPVGQRTRWDAEMSGGRAYRASHCFDAESGVWELGVTMENATGEYEITWHQRTDEADD